jgi:hypothetical protein
MLLLLRLRLLDVWPCLRLQRRRGRRWGCSVKELWLGLLCGAAVYAQALQGLCAEGRVPAQGIEPRVVHPQRAERLMANGGQRGVSCHREVLISRRGISPSPHPCRSHWDFNLVYNHMVHAEKL